MVGKGPPHGQPANFFTKRLFDDPFRPQNRQTDTTQKKQTMHISIDLDKLSDEEHYRIYTFLKLKFDAVERKKILLMDLNHVLVRQEIDTRTINLLKSRRIGTMQELAGCQLSSLERINGMGPRGLRQILRLLHHYGLELAEE